MKKLKVLLFFSLLFTLNAAAQLADFTLNVTKTDETCLGNGSLTFVTGNLTAQSSMLYKVYKMPNVSTPVSILTQNSIGSLGAGTYRVIAIQTLRDMQNSQQRDVTINNVIVPFNFSLSSSNQSCAQGGSIIVTTTSGTPASFEITSGPVMRPLQSSNTFDNLPAGTYKVRAFNNCGLGKVKTYTLSLVAPTITISDPTYSDLTTPVCDSVIVSNRITATTGTLSYPIAVQYELSSLSIGGQATIINKVYNTGSPTSLEIAATMPRYTTETYSYDVTVVDNCNTSYERDGITVNPEIKLSLSPKDAPCGYKFLSLAASNHNPPYTVNFISTPVPDFNPSDYNSLNLGPFNDASIEYGSVTNPMPLGNYVIEITDACGRIASESVLLEYTPPVPNIGTANMGCFSLFGLIRIEVPAQRVVSVKILEAPTGYLELWPQPQTLPHDVSAFIATTGIFIIKDIPIGTYKVEFTDDCGNIYVRDIVVPPFVPKDFNITPLPDCTAGIGTVRYRSGNQKLTSVFITDAPLAFRQLHTLPYDVSAKIDAQGNFYMNNLPEGSYVFQGTDVCEIVDVKPVNIEGYMPPQNSFTFEPSCGGFSVVMADASNSTEGVGYWLQKFNTATNTWGHPVTGVVYTEGDVPTDANGIKLANNATKNNLNFSGKFRIIKKFESFGDGTSVNTKCVSQLGDSFEYVEAFAINNAYNMACANNANANANDVYIDAVGYPVAYRITHKDGVPFILENGTSNIFVNLEPAEYIFEIEDACGNTDPKRFNVGTLPSIATANEPKDMLECTMAGNGSTNGTFRLTDQNADILGAQYSASYTITYHLSQADADNNVGALDEYFTNSTAGQTIYARIVHNQITLCYDTTSFKLFVGKTPVAKVNTVGTICNEGKIQISVVGSYDGYLWSTGETTRSIFVEEAGMYSVTVSTKFGNRFCYSEPVEVEIFASATPSIVKIETADWTRDENSITVITASAGNYQYSLDDVNYQEENIFTGLTPGVYNVYVKDVNGCGKDVQEIVLLNYPNFFTPNGDGENDKWQIKYSVLEPHMKISIFDRYGKLITTFGSNSEGWDGNLNGIQLPSTDYWFVVVREDGREHRGHFAMVR